MTEGIRRGLPRVAGGQQASTPPAKPARRQGLPRKAGETDAAQPAASVEATPAHQSVSPPTSEAPAPARSGRQGLARRSSPAPSEAPAETAASVAAATAARPRRAALARPSVPVPVPGQGSGRFGARTHRQLLGYALIGGFGLLIVATVVVLAAAWFVKLEFMRDFLAAFPGEYHLPESAPSGFPAWVQWQHFFNVFLMVLIIRSGLQVRTEKRPGAYWTPKWSKDGKGKISLALWFHQSLDILWLVNGVVFVVLLFVTGHWMRIVPTSWEVFPNALSALLQYMSLDWPTENGWVNYNSLQQLMYFITVFIAAPLAAITGVRMSGLWPKNAKSLNRVYPVEWARAIHFPVMLYFTGFITVHVALVFATGTLRNLNHMYGGTDVVNWAGFWIFFVSLVIITAGWTAARPLVLAPIAKLSGKVTGR